MLKLLEKIATRPRELQLIGGERVLVYRDGSVMRRLERPVLERPSPPVTMKAGARKVVK